MTTDDVVSIAKKTLELTYAKWQQCGEPVKPDTREAEIIIAEAMTMVLQDMIEKRKKETQ